MRHERRQIIEAGLICPWRPCTRWEAARGMALGTPMFIINCHGPFDPCDAGEI